MREGRDETGYVWAGSTETDRNCFRSIPFRHDFSRGGFHLGMGLWALERQIGLNGDMIPIGYSSLL